MNFRADLCGLRCTISSQERSQGSLSSAIDESFGTPHLSVSGFTNPIYIISMLFLQQYGDSWVTVCCIRTVQPSILSSKQVGNQSSAEKRCVIFASVLPWPLNRLMCPSSQGRTATNFQPHVRCTMHMTTLLSPILMPYLHSVIIFNCCFFFNIKAEEQVIPFCSIQVAALNLQEKELLQ